MIDFVPTQAGREADPDASWFAQQLLSKKWMNPEKNRTA